MSDQRLEELGLPRREFLKRAAVGAFTAPLIVSFGLAGTAEAASLRLPNQSIANQTHSLFTELTAAAWTVWVAQNDDSTVEPAFGKTIRGMYLEIAGNVLNEGQNAFCANLAILRDEITKQSGVKIDAPTASDLLAQINSLRATYCETP